MANTRLKIICIRKTVYLRNHYSTKMLSIHAEEEDEDYTTSTAAAATTTSQPQ
jgi:hypothetical protein